MPTFKAHVVIGRACHRLLAPALSPLVFGLTLESGVSYQMPIHGSLALAVISFASGWVARGRILSVEVSAQAGGKLP